MNGTESANSIWARTYDKVHKQAGCMTANQTIPIQKLSSCKRAGPCMTESKDGSWA